MVHDFQEFFVGLDGAVKQLIDPVGISQVVKRIRGSGPFLQVIGLVRVIDVIACIEQVPDGPVLLVGILKQADTDLVFEIVVARV